MQLYEVKVVDSVLRRAANAKIFVQAYVTLAPSPIEAAQNVARENTVHPTDRVIVAPAGSLTISVGSRHYFPRDIEKLLARDGTHFIASDLPITH